MGHFALELSSKATTGADPTTAPGGEPAGGPVPAAGGDAAGQAPVLARLLETAGLPFVGVSYDGRITCVNRAFTELAGARDDSLVGSPIAEITPPAHREDQARALAKVKGTGKSRRFTAEILRRDGRVVPIEVSAEPDRDERGEPVGVFAFVTDLTERKKSEDALRDSEERFRRLYDDAPVGYHEADTEGRITNINRTECEMLGYSREEMLGRLIFDFVAEEYRDAALAAFPAKVRGEHPLQTIERTLVTRDGRQLVMAIEERHKRDDAGRIVGMLSTLQDVTERNRTEAALQASERRSRALFEGIEDAVFVHALDGRILDANPAASRLLGYTREELLELTTQQIDGPGFVEGYEVRLANQLAEGTLTCEGWHRTKDGRVVPVEVNSSVIMFDDRLAVLAVIRDTTERLALEETRQALADAHERNAREVAAKNAELTVSEARYRQLTEGCLDGVVVSDRRGLVTLFNPAAERMFAHEAADVLGLPIARLMPGSFPDCDDASFEECVRHPATGLVGKTVEMVGVRKGGEEFPLELSLGAVEPGGEVQFIGSIRDQTERQRMRAMLTASEKLASIGLLSAGVAHEINNPLAYVGNNIAVFERDMSSIMDLVSVYEAALPELESAAPEAACRARALSDDLDLPYVKENLPRMISRTREGVQRVANIVSSLRGLARTSPPVKLTTPVPELLESALEMVRGRLRRSQIEVIVEHGTVPPVSCVPEQIGQVVLNLLINAAQAVESSGRGPKGWVRFASGVEGDMAVLAVSDNGCGIEPDAFPRLFDPFYTTKSLGEGTGLGLSICHGIVTGHGGRIEVESRPGAGTTFRVLLPLTPR